MLASIIIFYRKKKEVQEHNISYLVAPATKL